jgi:hypothetical protein
MSGRVRWKRDGETVTGFRKTARRQSPSRPLKERLHELALKGAADTATRVRLAFVLPPDLLISKGPHPGGVEVIGSGFVRVASWSAEKCFERTQAFLANVAKDRAGFTRTAVIVNTQRPDERYVRHLSVTRGAVVISSGYHEPRIYEAA